MISNLINANPIVHKTRDRPVQATAKDEHDYAAEPIDQLQIFNYLRDIKDPEHSYSLEELNIIREDSIEVDNRRSYIRVTFTPTVPYCTLATAIGLCLRVKLMRYLPSHYKIDIKVAPGSHATEVSVNKQLNDKERVAAALESPKLLSLIEECVSP